MEPPRILVVGAGVNGSICAARLHHAGIEVTVLARSKRYNELREQGIVIEDPFTNKRTLAKVPVIDSLALEDRHE